MVEKWSLQALENSLELEIMEPFRFNSFTVVLLVRREVSSLMVCHVFSRITFRLTTSIRIIRCFRSLDVIVYCISQLFVLCPVAWIVRCHRFSFGSITIAHAFL